MSKKHATEPATIPGVRLPDDFWVPANLDFHTELEEFNRLFGLRPDLAEAVGLRQFHRQDTLKSVN